MNSTFNNTTPEYKKCAGKGCERTGTRILRIRFLNNAGIFCELCANDLLADDLAVAERDVMK
jgi:hypothetical protein